MNRNLLEKPFEPAQIRQRKGRNGLLDYIEGHSVIHRLNQALDGAWSFEITHHEIREDEVLVLGKLTAEGITKMAFGTSQVTRERGSGTLISLGDDLKAASTDAMKKCATFLGVGLHLYADKPLAGPAPAMRAATPTRPPGPPGTPPARPASPAPLPRPSPNGNGAVAPDRMTGPAVQAPEPLRSRNDAVGLGDRITERQLDAISRLAVAKRLRPAEIDAISLRAFNRKPDELTHAEGSSLIKELSNRKRQMA